MYKKLEKEFALVRGSRIIGGFIAWEQHSEIGPADRGCDEKGTVYEDND